MLYTSSHVQRNGHWANRREIGIDASRFANNTPTDNSNPVALFLGRLDDEKKIDVLLRAVAKLTEHPKLQVELVGDGGERQRLGALARELGIEDRVHFLGHVSDQELPGIYERCTVFVMPSIAELQSIATMEAMASGRPVIGADAMALPHLVHDGDNGYLFPPGDVDRLADRLRRVLTADQVGLAGGAPRQGDGLSRSRPPSGPAHALGSRL